MRRVIVDSVSKQFRIGSRKKMSALERFVSLFSGREPKKDIWALKDITFNADSKEIIGIVGGNGSGKTTLLRVIAGIYSNTDGRVEVSGKVVSLINLKVEMEPRLTMKDNIYVICSLFGLSQKEIKNSFNPIVEFAELEDFIDTKTYQFSEGMKQRLTFSMAVHSAPEILLLDEVFEVGDENFKTKSAGKIKELAEDGATILFVSHDLDLVKRHCDRAIWIEDGIIKQQGPANGVVEGYKKKRIAVQ